MKKIFLYGAGGYGKAALDAFAENGCIDMVVGVIDNNPGLKNAKICGKPILPYSEVLDDLNSNSTVIISVELETSIGISNQLKRDGKIRYLHWAYEQYDSFDEVISITQENNDYVIFSHSLLKEIETLQKQKDYLLAHCNPQHMKPATGILRNRQLQLVEFAKEISDLVASVYAYPFISSGNLLGYVRHGGFIPWDDDFDFAILRSEYNKMKEYLCANYYYSKYNGPLNDDTAQLKWIKKEMDEHQGEIVILERPFLFRACKKTADGEYLLVDFFPFDEFKETASYAERLSRLQSDKKMLTGAETVDEYYSVIEKINDDDSIFREQGGTLLGFGYDVRESYSGSKYSGFIRRESVLPLKTVVFEGKEFWCPFDPDVFLKYEFGDDYMELPGSIGLHFSPEDIKKI